MLRMLAALFRFPVSVMVAVSSGFGYLLVHPVADARLALLALGTFCLASACSAVNQIQERRTDALFSRTAHRPLAAGAMSVPCVAALACVMASLACLCFYLLNVPMLFWLSGGIVLLYNGVYTPLKRTTAFALLVGAIPGAMPPVMGWAAAGGDLADFGVLLVFAVYYLWQVPHFWLRVERDRVEYSRAGLPIPIVCFGEQRYLRLLRLWFHAYLVAILMLPLFGHMQTASMRVAVTAAAMVMFGIPGVMLVYNHKRTAVFHWVNASIVLVMCLMLADRIGFISLLV